MAKDPFKQCDPFYDSNQQNCRTVDTIVQNSPTVSSFVELRFKSDHIAWPDQTPQNCFVVQCF